MGAGEQQEIDTAGNDCFDTVEEGTDIVRQTPFINSKRCIAGPSCRQSLVKIRVGNTVFLHRNSFAGEGHFIIQ